MTDAAGRRIVVVGAGAIGCYFGAMLARAKADVTLVGRAATVDAIGRDGLLLVTAAGEQRLRVRASTDIAEVRGAALILFSVKSADTESVARAIAPHAGTEALVLSLQNGVDNPERIRAHVPCEVLPVLIYIGANRPSPAVVRHTGGDRVVIGRTKEFRESPAADCARLADIAALLGQAGFAVTVSSDIEADLWTKLTMNCAYNAISALGSARYGLMVALPEVRAVMADVVAEVVQVARAKDVVMPATLIDEVFQLAAAMPHTMSSTAQDLAKGRRTEIDHLNGYVAREGGRLGIATPINRTLTALMQLAEERPRS